MGAVQVSGGEDFPLNPKPNIPKFIYGSTFSDSSIVKLSLTPLFDSILPKCPLIHPLFNLLVPIHCQTCLNSSTIFAFFEFIYCLISLSSSIVQTFQRFPIS
jgi:hypothetical protein